MKRLTIIDKSYKAWVKQLSQRYRQSQIKAAVKVNSEMLRFYYCLGHDIFQKKAEARLGAKFFDCLSRDLKALNPGATCFSPMNLLYMKNFYLLYSPFLEQKALASKTITPQVAEQLPAKVITLQVAERLWTIAFSVPRGLHADMIDRPDPRARKRQAPNSRLQRHRRSVRRKKTAKCYNEVIFRMEMSHES